MADIHFPALLNAAPPLVAATLLFLPRTKHRECRELPPRPPSFFFLLSALVSFHRATPSVSPLPGGSRHSFQESEQRERSRYRDKGKRTTTKQSAGKLSAFPTTAVGIMERRGKLCWSGRDEKEEKRKKREREKRKGEKGLSLVDVVRVSQSVLSAATVDLE